MFVFLVVTCAVLGAGEPISRWQQFKENQHILPVSLNTDADRPADLAPLPTFRKGVGAVKASFGGTKDYLMAQSINLPKYANPVYHYRQLENKVDTISRKTVYDESNEVLRKETDMERQQRRKDRAAFLSSSFSGGRRNKIPNANLADSIRSKYRKYDMQHIGALKDPEFEADAATFVSDPLRKGAQGNWGLRRGALAVDKSVSVRVTKAQKAVSARATKAKNSAFDQGARAACMSRTRGRGPCDKVIRERQAKREEKANQPPLPKPPTKKQERLRAQKHQIKSYFDEKKAQGVELKQRPTRQAKTRRPSVQKNEKV